VYNYFSKKEEEKQRVQKSKSALKLSKKHTRKEKFYTVCNNQPQRVGLYLVTKTSLKLYDKFKSLYLNYSNFGDCHHCCQLL